MAMAMAMMMIKEQVSHVMVILGFGGKVEFGQDCSWANQINTYLLHMMSGLGVRPCFASSKVYCTTSCQYSFCSDKVSNGTSNWAHTLWAYPKSSKSGREKRASWLEGIYMCEASVRMGSVTFPRTFVQMSHLVFQPDFQVKRANLRQGHVISVSQGVSQGVLQCVETVCHAYFVSLQE